MTHDIHFGSVDAPLPDWRKEVIDGDNDEDAPATKDVIAILGFDPKELEE